MLQTVRQTTWRYNKNAVQCTNVTFQCDVHRRVVLCKYYVSVHFICYIHNFIYFYYTTMQRYFTYASDVDDKRECFYCQYLFNTYWFIFYIFCIRTTLIFMQMSILAFCIIFMLINDLISWQCTIYYYYLHLFIQQNNVLLVWSNQLLLHAVYSIAVISTLPCSSDHDTDYEYETTNLYVLQLSHISVVYRSYCQSRKRQYCNVG